MTTRVDVGGSSCSSPFPVLEQMGVGRAPPLGVAPLLPLAVAGGAGFGRAGKSGGGTELLLTLPPRPPSPHTRPDTRSLVRWYPGCGVWFGGGIFGTCDYFSHFGGADATAATAWRSRSTPQGNIPLILPGRAQPR